MALGSKDELLVHLNFLKDLSYISNELFDNLTKQYNEVGRMLYGLIKSLKL